MAARRTPGRVTNEPDDTTHNVLLVEDDDLLSQRLSEYLSGRGFGVTIVESLPSARDLLKRHAFDAVVLDLNLGRDDGLVLARELAARGGPPVVIASARIEESDRVLGLELGADDYLVKPYSFRELFARLKVVIRRAQDGGARFSSRRVARFGRWTADLTAQRVFDESGEEVVLTAGEMDLLKVFLDHPDRVLLRNQLVSMTHTDDAEVFDRAIDVLVGRLRRKLEVDPRRPQLIRTVRTEGYRFTGRVEWTDS
jgi:two-component system, OmpR family, response regulator